LENNILDIISEKHPNLIEKLVSQIANAKAKILGFSVYSRNRKATFDFANKIHKLNPSKIFVFGGPEVLFEYHRNHFFKEANLDNSYFVLGEGELPLLNIYRHTYENKDVKFNLYKDKKLIAYNEVDKLDSLPFIDFDNLKIELYDSKILPLFSSRGCIKRCSFCSEYKLYKSFRQHSPEYIVDLIKNLTKKYGAHYKFNYLATSAEAECENLSAKADNITTFSFQDSLINANLQWVDKFCSLVVKNNLNIKWEAQIAVRNDMSKDLLKLMKSSGCYNLFVGLESGSDRMLELMNKGYTSQNAKAFLQNLRESGLQFEISLITGFPNESEEDFKHTLLFIKNNKRIIPKIAQVNPFVEYPPSKINKTDLTSAKTSRERVPKLIKMFDEENIKHTSSFINNLIEK
jgi:radical SAM superfamily enzyme YgiQ (UPF0313 family)